MRGTGATPSGGADNLTAAYGWQRREVIDQGGERVGWIVAIFGYEEAGAPIWAGVRGGRFSSKGTLVPITAAQASGERVRVPYTRELINSAPRIDPNEAPSAEEEADLYRHYGLVGTEGTGSGEAGEQTDDAMTRSEEELDVHTARRERGRARLRKVVVTEEVRRTVPVEREEIRIEREPITEENIDAAMSGPEISPAEHEVVLYEDEPVVEKRVVPKERVRLEKETHREQAEVTEEVRREQIETEEETDR